MNFNIGNMCINIKPSFFAVLMIAIVSGLSGQFFVLAACTTLHEAAHILTGRLFGLKCSGVFVSPLGEMAVLEDPESISPIKRLTVALSGITVNILLAVFIPVTFVRGINIALAAINLFPAYPLDGGRAVFYLLSDKVGTLNAHRITKTVSKITAYGLVVLGFVQMVLYTFNISIFCIGVYILKYNKKSLHTDSLFIYRLLYRPLPDVAKINVLYACENTPVKKLLYRLDRYNYTLVYTGTRVVTREQIVNYIRNNGMNGSVKDIFASKNSLFGK